MFTNHEGFDYFPPTETTMEDVSKAIENLSSEAITQRTAETEAAFDAQQLVCWYLLNERLGEKTIELMNHPNEIIKGDAERGVTYLLLHGKLDDKALELVKHPNESVWTRASVRVKTNLKEGKFDTTLDELSKHENTSIANAAKERALELMRSGDSNELTKNIVEAAFNDGVFDYNLYLLGGDKNSFIAEQASKRKAFAAEHKG